MNHLSWMLYWINVIPHIQTLCGITLVALVIITFFTCITYAIGQDGIRDTKAYEDKWLPRLWKALKWYVAIFIVAIIGFVFVPNQKTVVLIAASEIGEKVVNNPTINAINSLATSSSFPSALLPVYASQCVRLSMAKLILTGQLCAWQKILGEINNTPINIIKLFFIKRTDKTHNQDVTELPVLKKIVAARISMAAFTKKAMLRATAVSILLNFNACLMAESVLLNIRVCTRAE